MPRRRYLACIGTRPEIIKMAPVCRELKARGCTVLLAHTGQHEAVADALYAFFGMQPDVTLVLKRKSPSLAHLSSALLDGLEDAMPSLDPDVVLVQGDTTSALAGALVGYYHDKPVAHVEAGLRTREREPFPEEMNRTLIGRLARWHFPPTRQSRENLLREGVDPGSVFEVGNTVIDAALWARARLAQPSFDLAAATPANLREFLPGHAAHRLLLVTAHRRENWGQPIRNIARAVGAIIGRHRDAVAVWPVHPNPAVRADVEAEIASLPQAARVRICLTEPLGYPCLIALLAQCELVLTDSGGIQEEASAFGKPVLVARTSTERQELVDAGGACLVGTGVDGMIGHADRLLVDRGAYRSMQLAGSPFGDGTSATQIADILTGSARSGAVQPALLARNVR